MYLNISREEKINQFDLEIHLLEQKLKRAQANTDKLILEIKSK